MKYSNNNNSNGTYYYYARNSRGDIIGLYNADGTLYCTYTYDVWGNILSVKDTNDHELTAATDIANLQSLKYRGYYYDYETGLYYLQSRYYDPVTHRFINADGLVSTGTGVLGYNMFAYTLNCPVSLSDSAGNRPIESTTVSGESRDNRKLSCEHQRKALAETKKNEHNANRRPNLGEPGSTVVMPNGDRRTYGDDGYPAKDYDHSDHGFPDKHPHDENGGHYHDWDWSDPLNPQRSDPYVITWDPSSTTWASLGALILIAVDDFTGVGVADDFAIPVILAALFADGI